VRRADAIRHASGQRLQCLGAPRLVALHVNHNVRPLADLAADDQACQELQVAQRLATATDEHTQVIADDIHLQGGNFVCLGIHLPSALNDLDGRIEAHAVQQPRHDVARHPGEILLFRPGHRGGGRHVLLLRLAIVIVREFLVLDHLLGLVGLVGAFVSVLRLIRQGVLGTFGPLIRLRSASHEGGRDGRHTGRRAPKGRGTLLQPYANGGLTSAHQAQNGVRAIAQDGIVQL